MGTHARLAPGLLVALALGLGELGCGEPEPDGAAGDELSVGAESETETSTEVPTEAGGTTYAAPEVVLLEAGTGDAEPLRLHAAEGDTSELVIQMQGTMAMAIDGEQHPTRAMPVMKTVLRTRTLAVDDDGRIRREWVVQAVQVEGDSPEAEAIRRGMQPLEGVRGWEVIDPRGWIAESGVDLPPTARPELRNSLNQLRQSLKELTPPFPDEPVGVGARWMVRSTPEIGFVARQESTYTLAERDGERVALEVDSSTVAERQPVDSGHPQVAAELLEMQGHFTSRMTIDLGRLAPGLEGRSNARIVSQMSVPGQPARTTVVDTANQIRIRSEP